MLSLFWASLYSYTSCYDFFRSQHYYLLRLAAWDETVRPT